MTHLGWNSQFCGEFSFSVRAAAGILYRNSEDFQLHLSCSGVVHEGYNSVHQTGASRCVKWPFFITRCMEFVEIRKCSERLIRDFLGE